MSFLEHLAEPLPQTAKLQGTGGKTWTTSFTKIGERVYFTNGWSKFAEDHDLKDGEFLTFVYDGLRIFEVSVFGRYGCKETRAESEDDEEDDEEEEEEEEEQEEQEDPSMDSEETESGVAVVAQSSSLEVDTNPWFITNLKNRTYELLIPAQVVKDNDLRFGESIKYLDEEGSMVGKKGKWSDDRVCFKGWDRICRRNRLKERDLVKCELVHVRKLVHSIKIYIVRA